MTETRTKHLTRTAVILAFCALVAAVACGAAANKEAKKETAKAPLSPTTYNPQLSLSPLVDKVAAAVVNVNTKAHATRGPGMYAPDDLFEWFFGPRTPRGRQTPGSRGEQRSLGSGFIVDKSGLVVTNNHVIQGADEIEVQLSDDRKFKAEVLGSDERTDVAVLKLKNAKDLPTVSFGDSEKLRVGDHVVAIGNPFGLDHTVTAGIVSAKARVIGAGPYDDFIQTDASINPGNSGGPLFNLSGEVVGINTAIAPQGQGIGFAIPSNMAQGVIAALGKGGKVVRGWLGIAFQPLDENLAKAFGLKVDDGVIVSDVTAGSPAAKSGMLSGDVITKVSGVKVDEPRQLPSIVAKLEPGKKVAIEVLRAGKTLVLSVEVGKLPESGVAQRGGQKEQTPGALGFRVQPLTPELKARLGVPTLDGVVVSALEPGSPAAENLQPGDVITEVNRRPIKNERDFAQATSALKTGDDLLLRVLRGDAWAYIVIRL